MRVATANNANNARLRHGGVPAVGACVADTVGKLQHTVPSQFIPVDPKPMDIPLSMDKKRLWAGENL